MSKTLGRRPSVSVWCCGGAGANLGYMLKEHRVNEPGPNIYSEFNIRFIDTSLQNYIGKDISVQDDVYVFNNAASDGSGGVRRTNAQLIENTWQDVFKKFPMSNINIVLFGMSGGTGALAGAVLARELIRAGRPTIIVAVGGTDTLKQAQNTRATFETLQAISRILDKPVILNYHENPVGWRESEVDQDVIFSISSIAIMLSGAADRIDTADITNFMNYTAVSPQPASLTALHIALDDTPLHASTNPFAALTVARNEDVPGRGVDLDFSKIGYLPTLISQADAIHYFLDKPSIADNFARLQATEQRLLTVSESRSKSFDFGVPTDDTGIVFD